MDIACAVRVNEFRGLVEFTQTQEEWDKRWERDEIYYTVDFSNMPKLLTKGELTRAVNIAMTTWDIEIPVKFKSIKGSAADITISFAKKEDDDYFKDKPSVLAYAYFPGQGQFSGKVVFNADYIWDLKGKGIKAKDAIKKGLIQNASYPDSIIRTYNIYQTLIHELGHSIGLRHDATGNGDGRDVMDPFYDGSVLDLSDRDIERIRDKYGVRQWKHKRYGRIKRWLKRTLRK